MGRPARIAIWSLGILTSLVIHAAGADYLFLTSADFRSRVVRSVSPQILNGRVIPIPTAVIDNAKNVACEAATRQLFSTQP
jgi:hypothetical protein